MFYLAICLIIELAIFVAGYYGWFGFLAIKGWLPAFLLFGTIWIIAFYCAARISMAQALRFL